MTEAMGHGVNQRKSIQMTPAEIDAFLAERRAMTMCSIGPDGSIHAIAMWYGFLDGCVAVETKTKSQKVQNLRRDPRLTLLFEDGETYEELRGVELVGRGEVIDDPDRLRTLGISVFERYNGALLRGARAVPGGHAAQAGGGADARRAHGELGPPQARPAVDAPRRRRVNFTVDADLGVSAAAALRAYGSPAFYEGRDTVDNIAIVGVVDHVDEGDRVLIAVRFKFLGSVSAAVKAVIDPDKMSWVTRTEILMDERRTTFTVVPDHYPDRLSGSGEYCFIEGTAPGTAVVTVEGDLTVHVPLVGRSVEKVIVSGVRSYIAEEMERLPDFVA